MKNLPILAFVLSLGLPATCVRAQDVPSSAGTTSSPARAAERQAWAVALGPQKVGGVIWYLADNDGRLAGRYSWAGSTGIFQETAVPRQRRSDLAGAYDVVGTQSAGRYSTTLDLSLRGKDVSSGLAFYSLKWGNGDAGNALYDRGLVAGAIAGEISGILLSGQSEDGQRGWNLRLVGFRNGKSFVRRLEWLGELLGNHNDISDGQPIIIARDANARIGVDIPGIGTGIGLMIGAGPPDEKE